MADLKNIENKVKKVNELANELAYKANNEISILKHKITCLTVLIGLLFILGASVSIYAIHSFKELFYSMEIEEVETVTYDNEVEQNTDNGGSNYFVNNSNNNKIGE